MADVNLWTDPYVPVKEALRAGTQICERWAYICDLLTGKLWKRFTPHEWTSAKMEFAYLKQMKERLQEVRLLISPSLPSPPLPPPSLQILSLRSVHEHISRLLSHSDKTELGLANAFRPFASVQPLAYNPYTAPLWQRAVSQFEAVLEPAEQRIAGKLREQLRQCLSQPHQLLREFQRYKELVRRPIISRALVTEREALLAELSTFLKQVGCDRRQAKLYP